MSMDMQRQIRENTLELNEFLKDLKGWEQTVKEKERKTQGQGPSKDSKNSGTNAPRRKLPPSSKPDENDVHNTFGNEAEVEKKSKDLTSQAEVKKQGVSSVKPDKAPASHTHDHFRGKWDNYDVDAALKELDNEGEDDRPVKKVPKKEIRPPRGSNSKASADKPSEGRRKDSAVSPSLPPGKTAGGATSHMAAYGFDDAPPDAASEKDLGNEYFKEGKYVRAIDCYSRSIALQPTAVAYANRAMAAIKIRRYEDAEVDCTEAIALDDRYTKAYARRGTARRELKKYLGAVEDLEFALRLEPENKELRNQYTEVEELHQKERGGKVPKQQKSSPIVKEREENIPSKQQPKSNKPTVTLVDKPQSPSVDKPQGASVDKPQGPSVDKPQGLSVDKPQRPSVDKPQGPSTPTPPEVFTDAIKKSRLTDPTDSDLLRTKNSARETPNEVLKDPLKDRDVLPSAKITVPDTVSNAPVAQKQARARERDRKMAEVVAATQAAAARAAASASAAVSRNIVAPRSSYEFELTWKGFQGNKSSQARLLKIMDPLSLPKVFKDSLGAPLLLEIIQALELLFPEDPGLAVQILENLAKVGRFNMTVMFLTSKDKTGLGQLWEQVFMKSSPQDLQTRLQHLRSVYRLV